MRNHLKLSSVHPVIRLIWWNCLMTFSLPILESSHLLCFKLHVIFPDLLPLWAFFIHIYLNGTDFFFKTADLFSDLQLPISTWDREIRNLCLQVKSFFVYSQTSLDSFKHCHKPQMLPNYPQSFTLRVLQLIETTVKLHWLNTCQS